MLVDIFSSYILTISFERTMEFIRTRVYVYVFIKSSIFYTVFTKLLTFSAWTVRIVVIRKRKIYKKCISFLSFSRFLPSSSSHLEPQVSLIHSYTFKFTTCIIYYMYKSSTEISTSLRCMDICIFFSVLYMYVYVYMYTCLVIYMYICIYNIYVYMYIQYICIYVYMYICIHVL